MENCVNHGTVPAAGRCTACAEAFCANCLVDIQGQKYCGSCKTLALQGKLPTAAAAVQEARATPCPLAQEALMYAIVSILCFGFITGPIAVFKGIKAHKMIADDPQLTGGGKATAAIILGCITTLLNIVGLAIRASHP